MERCAARHKTGRDYFAVILDWKMPEMDGIATARRIRECVGEDVTIIILSSFEFSEIEEEARAAGVDAFIAKPLFRSRLTATLRQFTSGKKEKNARNYLEDFAKTDYTGKRLLLVEDNDLNREIATEILGMTGVKEQAYPSHAAPARPAPRGMVVVPSATCGEQPGELFLNQNHRAPCIRDGCRGLVLCSASAGVKITPR